MHSCNAYAIHEKLPVTVQQLFQLAANSRSFTSYGKECAKFKNFPLCKIVEIKIGGKTRFENLVKQLFHSPLLDMK